MKLIKDVMICKENPLTGDWLCLIPGTTQAYYTSPEGVAKEFCKRVNVAFEKGELKLVDGEVIKTT